MTATSPQCMRTNITLSPRSHENKISQTLLEPSKPSPIHGTLNLVGQALSQSKSSLANPNLLPTRSTDKNCLLDEPCSLDEPSTLDEPGLMDNPCSLDMSSSENLQRCVDCDGRTCFPTSFKLPVNVRQSDLTFSCDACLAVSMHKVIKGKIRFLGNFSPKVVRILFDYNIVVYSLPMRIEVRRGG